MVALAALADVTALIGRALTTLEAANAATLLVTASNKVRAYTRQQIDQTLADTYTSFGSWGQRLILPQRPVTGITSISVNGTILDPANYAWNRNGDVDRLSGSFAPDVSGSFTSRSNLWGPAGSTYLNYATGPNWNGPQATITVVYDHGFAVIPGDVVDEVSGMVAAQIVNPVGISSEMIGNYKVVYARKSAGGSMMLTDEAKANLNRYRKRAATLSAATPH